MSNPCAVGAAHFLLAYAGFGPATLEFESEHWENHLFKPTYQSRLTSQYTLALRGDGSRAVRQRARTFLYYLLPGQTGVSAAFIDASKNVTVYLDVLGMRASVYPTHCPLPLPHQPPPKDCVVNDPFGATRLPDTIHLGMRVAVWRRHGGTEQWLAPKLNCAIVREVTTEFGDWHIPLRYSHRELKRIHFGEPDPQLFVIPPSFRVAL